MNRNLKENHDFAKHQQEIAEKKETMKLTKQSAVEMNSPKLEFKSSEACNNKSSHRPFKFIYLWFTLQYFLSL